MCNSLTSLPFNPVYPVFYSCDLYLDPMTLEHEFDLDILKAHLYTKNEVSVSKLSKVRAHSNRADRHTDRHERTHYRTAVEGDNNQNKQMLTKKHRQ